MSDRSSNGATMTCPICQRKIELSEKGTRFAPFCSDRCKLIDLGRWLTGKYQISVKDVDEEDGGNEPQLKNEDD